MISFTKTGFTKFFQTLISSLRKMECSKFVSNLIHNKQNLLIFQQYKFISIDRQVNNSAKLKIYK